MNIEGAMTAIVTPMRDGSPDFPALERFVESQIDGGIHGIVAVGTTGESASLRVSEHIEVVEQTVRFAAGRVPVVAGAGANSTHEAIALSKACEKAGANALLQVTPYYNKPSQEGLFRHFEAITDATDLPIILYNVPGRTSCDMHAETIARLAALPRIAAIKEASADMKRAGDIVRLCGDSITLLSGDDFTAFPLLCLGGKGVISVVSNVVPDRVAKMCNAAKEGDWAKALEMHYSFQALSELLFIESNPIPVKAAMHLLGMMGAEIRLPLTAATEATVERLRDCLGAEGLL
ncbi:MAG: 4-hydroxy-tetrahydrodipicolinate synthase [Myxococcales bacterium]|nr:4-hydroxy-tetrahydrodipicolinate synthase [Myxococcales bacterium]